MKIPDEINKIFGTLNKAPELDKCTNAIFQIRKGLKPDDCEFATAGKTVFCLKHGAVKV